MSVTGNEARAAAVIGLGQMGRGIARNLDKAGLLGGAWDIADARVAEAALSSAVRIAAPAALAQRFVLFAVPSTKEIEPLLTRDGLLASGSPPRLLIDLTTSDPNESRRLGALARERGHDYIDCAMSGGAAGAAAGTLTLMIGGAKEAVAEARPILEKMAGKLSHVGELGAGHAMKLIDNMICHTIFLATAEGCRAAERAGLDLPTVIDVINASNARSYISEVRFPKHILSGAFDGRSRVYNLAKDLGMAVDFTASMDQPQAFGPLTSRILQTAIARGMENEDFTRLYPIFDSLLAETLDEPA